MTINLSESFQKPLEVGEKLVSLLSTLVAFYYFLVGELLPSSSEGNMVIAEGETSNYVDDYLTWN